MRIEIAGNSMVSYRAAKDLISDFIKGNCPDGADFYIPETWQSFGLDNTYWALLDIVKVFPVKLWEKEEGDQADVLFVIDQHTEAELVDEYQKAGKPVYDLFMGLYPVTPLNGPQSDAETPTLLA